jgi:outer membrane lipoprotein
MHILSLLIITLPLLLQGCTYAISSDIVRTADRTVTFDKLQADPPAFKGKTVILGGVIDRIRNSRTGTLIEIVQKELDYWGKPLRTDRTGGRFLVVQPRHLDPLVYAPGRDITVAGEVTGAEEPSLADATARYPLITAREIKLWPRDKAAKDQAPFLDPLYDRDSPQDKFGY